MHTIATIRAQAAALNIRVWHEPAVDCACSACGEVTAVPASYAGDHPDDPGSRMLCANCRPPAQLVVRAADVQPGDAGWWWERQGDVEGPYESEVEALMHATLAIMEEPPPPTAWDAMTDAQIVATCRGED